MKHLKLTLVVAMLTLGIKAQADGLYDITFTDGGANVGFGQLDVESGFALSGFFTVTSGPAIGNWDLYTAGGNVAYPGVLTSPAAKFNYNNAVYLGTNPQYSPASNPFLDASGLLFTDANGDELNLWGNSDGTYSLYGFILANNAYDPQAIGVATITPTPEPTTLALLALMLVPAGICYQRRLR